MRRIINIISFKKKFGLFESSRLVAPLRSSSHNFLLETLLKINAPSLQAFRWKRRIGERILLFHFKLDRPSREATRSHQDVLFGRGGISPRTNVQTQKNRGSSRSRVVENYSFNAFDIRVSLVEQFRLFIKDNKTVQSSSAYDTSRWRIVPFILLCPTIRGNIGEKRQNDWLISMVQ